MQGSKKCLWVESRSLGTALRRQGPERVPSGPSNKRAAYPRIQETYFQSFQKQSSILHITRNHQLKITMDPMAMSDYFAGPQVKSLEVQDWRVRTGYVTFEI